MKKNFTLPIPSFEISRCIKHRSVNLPEKNSFLVSSEVRESYLHCIQHLLLRIIMEICKSVVS